MKLRKLVAAWLAMLMLCMLIPAGAVTVTAAEDNLIENGDFEAGNFNGWDKSWWAPEIVTDVVHNGNYAMKTTKTANQYQSMIKTQAIALEPDTDYKLTLWYRYEGTTANAQFYVYVKDASNTNIKAGYPTAAEPGKWYMTTVKFNSGSCESATVFLQNRTVGAGGAYYFDDVILKKDVVTDDGYLKNGDFETGDFNAGWDKSWYAPTIVNSPVHGGNYAMKTTNTANQYQTMIKSQAITVSADTDYKLTYWYYYDGTTPNAQFYMYVKDGGNSKNIGVGYPKAAEAGKWYQGTVEFNTGSYTTILLLLQNRTVDAGGAYYFDDFRIEAVVEEPAEPVPLNNLHNEGISIRDDADGSRGLAFRFFLDASNTELVNGNCLVPNTGTLQLFRDDATTVNLIETGAIVSNRADATLTKEGVDGKKTIQVTAKYLTDWEPDAIGFAVRIINIPEASVGTEIYARPYFTYEQDGETVTVYGSVVSDNYHAIANPGRTIKVLAIGNSFSVDAMKNHLYDVFESAGYEEIVLGNLYIAGCNLDTHWEKISTNATAYEYQKNSSGTWSSTFNQTALSALQEEKWDIITVQQASAYSGRPTSLGNLQNIVNWVDTNKTNANAKIYWHMTWAYQQDSTQWAFASYYNSDQMTMYNAIVDVAQNHASPVEGIDGVIPTGTAIQNLRTSGLGDTLTADGYHLEDNYGDYTAALTWYRILSGESLDLVDYIPAAVTEYHADVVASVNNAVQNPYGVTELD